MNSGKKNAFPAKRETFSFVDSWPPQAVMVACISAWIRERKAQLMDQVMLLMGEVLLTGNPLK